MTRNRLLNHLNDAQSGKYANTGQHTFQEGFMTQFHLSIAKIQKCFQIDDWISERLLNHLDPGACTALLSALERRRSDPTIYPGELVHLQLEFEGISVSLKIMAVKLAFQCHESARTLEINHSTSLSVGDQEKIVLHIPITFSEIGNYHLKSIQVVLATDYTVDAYDCAKDSATTKESNFLQFSVKWPEQLSVESKFHTLNDSLFIAQQVTGKLYLTNSTNSTARNVHLLGTFFHDELVLHECVSEISAGSFMCFDLESFVENGDALIVLYSDNFFCTYQSRFTLQPCFHIAFVDTDVDFLLLKNLSDFYISGVVVESDTGERLFPTHINLTPAQSCMLFIESHNKPFMQYVYVRCFVGSYFALFKLTL